MAVATAAHTVDVTDGEVVAVGKGQLVETAWPARFAQRQHISAQKPQAETLQSRSSACCCHESGNRARHALPGGLAAAHRITDRLEAYAKYCPAVSDGS
ncbi:MAG: hypothetical protein H6643_08270 [Caldilineaceae bacterium]|nr:hypothetical protein [Caldilineaceae bacterium]